MLSFSGIRTALVATSLTCLVLSSAAHAQLSDNNIWGDEQVVIVTASRTPSLLSKTPESASVISGEQIRASNAKSVADVISALPGIFIRPQGGAGSIISPSLRGSDAKQVLIMIDGVPVNDLRQGSMDLGLFPVDSIARVEIVRGPASSLYGANALGGVINIITKSSKTGSSLQLQGGDHNGKDTRFHTSASVAGGILQLSGGSSSSDGWRANSDYDSWNATARLDFTPKGWENVSASLVSFYDDKQLPGPLSFPTPKDNQDDINYLFRLSGQRRVNSQTDLTATLYSNLTKLDYNGMDWSSVPYKEIHKTAGYGTQLQLTTHYDAVHTFAYGADATQEKADSTSLNGTRWASTLAAFAEDRITLSPTDMLTIGGRLDTHSNYDGQFSPRFGYLHKFSANGILRANIGKAFRAPTFNELYWPYTDYGYGFSYQGNPDLKPERAWAADFGIEQRIGKRSVIKATGFQSLISDLISAGVTMPVNIGSAETKGVELEFNHQLPSRGTFFINYTTISAIDRSTKEALVRIPHDTLNVGLTQPLPKKGSLYIVSRWVGKRWDLDFTAYPTQRVRLPRYNVVDAKLSLPIYKETNLILSADNLFDTQYQDIADYPMPGRSYRMGLEYSF